MPQLRWAKCFSEILIFRQFYHGKDFIPKGFISSKPDIKSVNSSAYLYTQGINQLMKKKVTLFWFRRDLRLTDNRGLHEALKSPFPVLPLFIFDTEITDELPSDDARISFIYDSINALYSSLNAHGINICCKQGNPISVWKKLLHTFDIKAVYANEDYEPYAIQRDDRVKSVLAEQGVPFHLYKDQVIFAKNEVLKKDNTPYTIFTPYKNKWLERLANHSVPTYPISNWSNFVKLRFDLPALSELGFKRSSIKIRPYKLERLDNYGEVRNFPALSGTSHLGPHLRFGTVSLRDILLQLKSNETFVNELIWREFFMQILYHFPNVVEHNFKRKYDCINWRNNLEEFDKWKHGLTGYPMVDAGMRELKNTGYMHNRVRMVVASFLCKHLLIDWRWGETYFAKKLLDYELSSNNGNWQWASGTGCDAAPYFRVFNPTTQIKKFDPELKYIKKWVPELDTFDYPPPIVEHNFARKRAIKAYKEALR